MITKIDILAIGAHPDDIELGCGGTILNEIHKGKKVGLIDLTAGELGTRGSVEKRKQESYKASKILGVDFRLNLGMKDGFIKNDEKSQIQVIRFIRKYQPDVIICNAPDDRHVDHAEASKLVVSSSFLSGLVKINTNLDNNNQNPWRPNNVYHYIQWKNLEPTFVVDISQHIEKKMEAVLSYDSQFYNPKSEEPDTLISSEKFLDSITARSADFGRLIGVEHAEGFISNKLVGVKSLNDLL
ncbi:MAG: bacillithiol biosynthesis deacetylase BshB1 [Cryomorphaceae bacterium]|nr:MAG: bacillithiol biosynthesis deacetylase BshB1 [Cryomorphaceae bacterium]|tara:strand:- start:1586 stop:2308 length:723 start_codon:yes stop_codon:yes gene_type:complete